MTQWYDWPKQPQDASGDTAINRTPAGTDPATSIGAGNLTHRNPVSSPGGDRGAEGRDPLRCLPAGRVPVTFLVAVTTAIVAALLILLLARAAGTGSWAALLIVWVGAFAAGRVIVALIQ